MGIKKRFLEEKVIIIGCGDINVFCNGINNRNVPNHHHPNAKAGFSSSRPAVFFEVFSDAQRSGVGVERQEIGCGYSVGIALVYLAPQHGDFVICQKITISDFDVSPLSLFAYLLYLINNILSIILLILKNDEKVEFAYCDKMTNDFLTK